MSQPWDVPLGISSELVLVSPFRLQVRLQFSILTTVSIESWSAAGAPKPAGVETTLLCCLVSIQLQLTQHPLSCLRQLPG